MERERKREGVGRERDGGRVKWIERKEKRREERGSGQWERERGRERWR